MRRWGARVLLLHAVLLARSPEGCAAQDAGGLYCGRDDCYSLLGLARTAETQEIKKAYRKLAMKFHPDKNRGKGARQAEETFRKISRAHEVLADDQVRTAYDYYLDHPNDNYANYYRYYHAAYSPKTPLWAVALGTLSFLSVLQYINQKWKYESIMRAVQYQPKFKRRVNDLLEAEVASRKGRLSKLESQLLKEQVETRVLESEVQIGGGGFGKPQLSSLVLVRAALLPLDVGRWLWECYQWYHKFHVLKEEYGPEERLYLTRRALGLSEAAWESLEEDGQAALVARSLWERPQMEAYAAEQQEEMAEKMRNSGAYKRYKRHMKKSG